MATVRPPEYLRVWTSLHPALTALGPAPARRLDEPLYLFAPHDQLPLMSDAEERELTYGDTVITLAYVREHWTEMFELIDIDLALDDPHQIVLTLRRR